MQAVLFILPPQGASLASLLRQWEGHKDIILARSRTEVRKTRRGIKFTLFFYREHEKGKGRKKGVSVRIRNSDAELMLSSSPPT